MALHNLGLPVHHNSVVALIEQDSGLVAKLTAGIRFIVQGDIIGNFLLDSLCNRLSFILGNLSLLRRRLILGNFLVLVLLDFNSRGF